MRDGIYGIYNGVPHRISHDQSGDLLLFPNSESEIDDTYSDRYNLGIYSKVIKPEDLTEAYEIRSYAEYKGHKTDIARTVGDEYELWIDDRALAQELGFDRCDKFAYNRMVKKTDVNVVTEKVPYMLKLMEYKHEI